MVFFGQKKKWSSGCKLVFYIRCNHLILLSDFLNMYINSCRNRLFYAEVNCKGPGAQNTRRVPWEKKPQIIDLKKYRLSSFINRDKWLANIPIF